MNAIGTHLRDLINSRLTRWRLVVYINGPPRRAGGIPRVSTRFGLDVENEQADAGRDSRTRLTRRNFQARTGIGKYYFSLFSPRRRSGLVVNACWVCLSNNAASVVGLVFFVFVGFSPVHIELSSLVHRRQVPYKRGPRVLLYVPLAQLKTFPACMFVPGIPQG